MRHRVVCHLIALWAALLLSLGAAMHGAVTADPGARGFTVAAIEMTMSHDCDACGGNGGTPEKECYGVCSNPIDVLSHSAPLRVLALGSALSAPAEIQTSRSVAPDPSPPKPVVLS